MSAIIQMSPLTSMEISSNAIIISLDEPSQCVNFDMGVICLDSNLECLDCVYFSSKSSRDGSIQWLGPRTTSATDLWTGKVFDRVEDCM